MPRTSLRTLRLLFIATICLLLPEPSAYSQDAARYSYHSSLSLFGEYSQTSSHILIGIAQNRRIAAAGVTYSRLLRKTEHLNWSYDLDLIPIGFIQDPVSTTTRTVIINGSSFGPSPVQNGPIQSRCISSTYPDPSAGSQPGTIVTLTRVCGTRWSYLGGLSPLGQRINLLPRSKIQPYLAGNAGFLVSNNDVPEDQSSRFNFAFEFGTGIQFYRANGRAWAIDYRLHHLSNAGIGTHNAGVDSQIVRVVYIIRRN